MGFVHPGAMGSSLAAICHGDSLWCSADRSDETRARAVAAGMSAVGSLEELVEQSELSAVGNAPKAWRFAGELEEIAQAFAAHELPDGFATAAAEVYRRLERFKDDPAATLSAVIAALNSSNGRPR